MKIIRVIGILLIVAGVIGVILGVKFVFDIFAEIGIAALIGAITAILSGVGFLMIGKKLA